MFGERSESCTGICDEIIFCKWKIDIHNIIIINITTFIH